PQRISPTVCRRLLIEGNRFSRGAKLKVHEWRSILPMKCDNSPGIFHSKKINDETEPHVLFDGPRSVVACYGSCCRQAKTQAAGGRSCRSVSLRLPHPLPR